MKGHQHHPPRSSWVTISPNRPTMDSLVSKVRLEVQIVYINSLQEKLSWAAYLDKIDFYLDKEKKTNTWKVI